MTALRKLFEWSLVALFLGVFLLQAGYFAVTSSTVSDEVAHFGAGYSYVKFGNFELNLEHPPLVKEIAALPLLFMDLKFPLDSPAWQNREQWTLGRAFLYTFGNPAEKMIAAARLALFILPVFLGTVLYLYCRGRWGRAAGFFALFLFAFSPELIAHSLLVTTDFAAAAFFFATFYFMERFWKSSSMKDLAGVGICSGLALASKYSAIQIFPLLYFFAAAYGFAKEKQPLPALPKLILVFLTVLGVSHKFSAPILIPPLVYVWGKTFFPNHAVFKRLRIDNPVNMLLWIFLLSFTVVIFFYFEPASWFNNFKFNPLKKFFRGWTIFRDHSIGDTHRGFLLGEYSQKGWWYYYPAAMFFKIPIPILLLSLLGGLRFLWKGKISREQLYFLIPPALYFFIACFINKVNIGVRHVLPLYPYLLLLAVYGFLGIRKIRFPLLRNVLLPGILGVWLVFGTLSQFPNYLSYFNEFESRFGGRENILGDSNISWGQDLMRLRDYVKRNQIAELQCILQFNTPDEIKYYGIPFSDGTDPFKTRQPGIYVIDVYSYQSLVRDPAYAWLKTARPDEAVGGSLWIYKL